MANDVPMRRSGSGAAKIFARPSRHRPWYRRASAAVGRGLAGVGRWCGRWVRRLAASVYFWVGLVAGFGTATQMWESVLLLAVVGLVVGGWLWVKEGRCEVIALSLGIVLGWLPMLILFVGALPHTMIGPPGVSYDL